LFDNATTANPQTFPDLNGLGVGTMSSSQKVVYTADGTDEAKYLTADGEELKTQDVRFAL